MPRAIVDSFSDLIDHLSDYSGGDGAIDRAGRDYRRAAQMAYRDLTLDNEWKTYLTRGRLNLNPEQTSGTIDFDLTGGTYERQVTIADSTWPLWVAFGTLVVDGVHYKIDERKSNTVITLTEDSCPTVDIAADTSYTLFQNIYPLPEDFRRLYQDAHFENDLGCMRALPGLAEWLALEQHCTSGSRPVLYAIAGSPDTWQYGKMSIYLHPYPVDAESVDFIYWRYPRPLYYNGYTTECRVGTVTASAGSRTVTGASTQFTAKMVGSLIRFSRNTTAYPEGLGGLNPFQEQRVIVAVNSATSITVDEDLDYAYAANKYVVTDPLDADGALLTAIYRRAEMELDNYRNPERLPGRVQMYHMSYRQAMERDQRCTPSAGLYGVLWQSGGTNITQIISGDGDDDDPTPDPGGEDVPELLFSQTSIETVDTSTGEEALSGTGEGSLTIDAGSWALGDAITVRASGTYGSKTPTAGTLTLRLKWGSAITQVFTITLPDAQSSKTWTIESTLTRHSIGAGGTVSGGGFLLYAVTGELAPQSAEDPVANETCDTTVNQTIALTAQFSASDAANTITCSSLTVNQEGPN